MKKVTLALLIALMASPVLANDFRDDVKETAEAGVEVNAKIVRLTDNTDLGVRLSKNLNRTTTGEGLAAYITFNIDLTPLTQN